MKMNFKKTLSLILAVLMVITAVPLSGMATDAEACEHDFSVRVNAVINGKEYHGYMCSKCDEENLTSFERCNGGADVACGQKKKCAVCNGEYGAVVNHTFTEELVDEKFYVAGSGDCQHPKQYYKNCTNPGCDAMPTDLATAAKFEGNENGTCVYTNYVSDNNATCKDFGTKTAVCDVCGNTNDTLTDEESGKKSHAFTAKVEEDKYLVDGSVATCEKGAEYYYSCEYCGEKGTEKFRSEVTGNHVFHEMKDADFLKEKATCSKNAVYYKWCSACTRPANQIEGYEDETFEAENTKHAKPTSKDDVRRPLTDEEKVVIVNADCYTDAKYAMHCKECGEAMITNYVATAKEGIDFYEAEGTALNPGHRDLTKLELVTDRVEPSCTKAGQEAIYKCKEGINCPDANWDKIGGELIPEKGHAYDAAKTLTYKEAECGLAGHYGRKYCKDCDTSFYTDAKGADAGNEKGLKEKTIKALSHVNDLGDDDLCDICGAVVKPSETCKCICHKGGFMYIIAIFLKLFWRLTGTKEYCECSSVEEIVKHY